MVYIQNSTKKVGEIVDNIQQLIPNYKFGILHIHNVKETLNSKGVDFKNECQILDICSPMYANKFLSEDMTLSSIMPCKISIYTDHDGQTTIAMNSIVQLIDDINPDFVQTAQEIQDTLLKLIDEVK